MHLPDVNLWLALAFEAHIHHSRALGWFDQTTPDSCPFSRQPKSDSCGRLPIPAVCVKLVH